MKPYLHPDGGNWTDALIGAMLPGSREPLPFDEEDIPMALPIVRRSGWHPLRWMQANMVGMDAEHLMLRYGIPVADRSYPAFGPVTEVGFSVPNRQAEWAEYVLARAGFALTTPLLNPKHASLIERAQQHGASRPTGGGRIKRRGFAANYYGFMDELIGVGARNRERHMPQAESWQRQRYVPVKRGGLWSWLKQLFGG